MRKDASSASESVGGLPPLQAAKQPSPSLADVLGGTPPCGTVEPCAGVFPQFAQVGFPDGAYKSCE
ncbi:hypothetical protein [Pleurocapsa sp. FMAR1]|uniref:hypothetical protein n=1 Tax=Pleurocapsa sp. FMAR1 TaxID=3040204 RepID=UPI0029C89983|nr:hypothetical protein [Pleurocapsa sp. FMAR1]